LSDYAATMARSDYLDEILDALAAVPLVSAR
jgi:hypothetical protein